MNIVLRDLNPSPLRRVAALLGLIAQVAFAHELPVRCPEQPLPADFDPANPMATRHALKGAPRLFYPLGKDRRAQLAAALKTEDPSICVLGGLSLLSISASSGDIDEVRLLLENGAQPDRPANHGGSTPLTIALEAGHFSVARLLLEKGANVQLLTDGGQTPLHALAIATTSPEMPMQTNLAGILLARGIDINTRDHRGTTPLMLAVAAGNHDLVAYLLKRGADVSLRNKRGIDAETIARKKGDARMESLLSQNTGTKAD